MAREPEQWKGKTQTDFLLFIADDVIAYCDWYAENGLYLPSRFASDPGTWTQILRNIQAAFEVIRATKSLLIEHEYDQMLVHQGIEQYYLYSEHLWR